MTITIDGGAGITFPDAVQQTNGMTMTGGAPLYYAARAWVTFDGVSSATILSSVNVASVTRSTTGRYIVTFTDAMPNANYAVFISARTTSSSFAFMAFVDSGDDPTPTTVRIRVVSASFPAAGSTTAAADSPRVSVVVFA